MISKMMLLGNAYSKWGNDAGGVIWGRGLLLVSMWKQLIDATTVHKTGGTAPFMEKYPNLPNGG